MTVFTVVKHGLMLFLTVLFFSSCSSLNPFAKDKAENLNALTYGENYDNGRPSNGTWSSNDDRNAAFGESASSPRSSRSPAATTSVKSNDEGAYYGKDKKDASEEEVASDIERGRGYAGKSGFTRGDRATKADFQDNTPNDGSLWANENDANYFFTKGKVRSTGDIISIKLEDPMIKQFAEEIKKTLTPAEQEVEMALYRRNDAAAKDDADLKAYRNVASDDLKCDGASDVKDRMEKAVRWSQVDLAKVIGFTPNEELRAEIIDRYQNGNYKIRAVKRVLYRGSSKLVSVVGVAPATDFDDKDLIASSKLYEYKIRVAH
jgi:flagellar basal body L-ring protein FlgH